jgi:5-aminopentanamidase
VALTIAACQTPEILGDVEAALAYMSAPPDADVVLFPEAFLQGYLVEPDHVARHALDLNGSAFSAIRERLRQVRPALVFGMLERAGGSLFNSAVVVDRGELRGVYRKTHLTAAEAEIFMPGREFPVFNMHGICFGLNICYDTRFPDAALAVRAQGAQVLLVLAQNMMRHESALRWKDTHSTVRRIRAEETGMWLISADVTGERDPQRIGWGPTSVIDPGGRVVAQVPLDAPGTVTVQIAASSSFSKPIA